MKILKNILQESNCYYAMKKIKRLKENNSENKEYKSLQKRMDYSVMPLKYINLKLLSLYSNI